MVIATLLQAMGEGKLVTVEHDLDYLRLVDSDLFAHGLKSFVDLRHLPIVSFSAAPPPLAACHSYELCQLDAPFDVALLIQQVVIERDAERHRDVRRLVPFHAVSGLDDVNRDRGGERCIRRAEIYREE